MREDRISAHRFRWLLAAVLGLLLWQSWEVHRLHKHIEEAVATAEDASEYARRAWDAADKIPAVPRPMTMEEEPAGEGRIEWRRANGDPHYSEIPPMLQQQLRDYNGLHR